MPTSSRESGSSPGPRAVAVNVAANTNEPGFRGPVYPDGSFVYVPIPEVEATRTDAAVPTYADLDLPFSVPSSLRDRPVHLDPEFPGVHGSEDATYGDPYGVKARPISELAVGDWLLFYATLTLRPPGWDGPGSGDRPGSEDGRVAGDGLEAENGTVADAAEDLPPDWGAFLVGGMQITEVVAAPDRNAVADRFASNAHLKRDPFDARVLVRGDPAASGLFDRVVPLSTSTAGAEANRLVTDLSADSGKGPWWRRPLRFDAGATEKLLGRIGP